MEKLFEKIEIKQDGKDCKIMPWNREYTLSSTPFFSSIISNGEQLLARPMELVGVENGKELKLVDGESLFMNDISEQSVSTCQYFESSSFVFNTSVKVEEDGYARWGFTISSKGRSVAQVFGLNKNDDNGRVLEKLWLEIPLKKSVAVSYQFAESQKDIYVDGKIPSGVRPLNTAGAMAKTDIKFPFVEQVFISNDKIGFALMLESDENWQYADDKNVIECIVKDDEVVLRLHLLDSESEKWKNKKDYNDGLDLIPLVYRFSTQVTPIKEYPANPYTEKNMHIDCFKKILEPYEEFLFKPYANDTDIALDRIKRMGVNTLYIHEKWNDIQNSPIVTKRSADRLKLIVDEAHKRGMKVIPYFGSEMSSLDPAYAEHGEEYTKSDIHWHWYRYPYQRALRVCPNSNWQDEFIKNYIKLYDEFGFDGLYLDSLYPAEICRNTKHGCGYVGVDGQLHGTYPVGATRRFMQKMYKAIKERGGTVCLHLNSTFPLNMVAYADCLWEGEPVQVEFLKGKVERVPEGYYRSVYSGRNIGVPINMLCYSSDVWSYDEAMSNALFLGIIPKPVDIGDPLEKTSALWKVLDGYAIEKAKWVNCYEGKIIADNDNLRIGYYQTDNDALCFVTNLVKAKVEKANVTLDKKAKKVCDAYTNEILAENCNSFTLDVEQFAHRIFKIEY